MTSKPPPICASVMAASTAAALSAMERAAPHCARLELRLDAAPPGALDLAQLVAASPRPLVVTNRPPREGGFSRQPEAERLALLARAARLGATCLDVECDAVDALPELPAGTELIVSHHARQEPAPAELPALFAKVRHPRATIQKVVVPVAGAEGALRLLALGRAEAKPTVAIGMGFPGVVSRLAGPRYGAPFVYAAADGARPAAPGQLPASRLAALWGGGPPRADSLLLGVIGQPVAHSRSPELHNAALAELGIPGVYSWLETREVEALLEEAGRDPGVRGFSVTMPHKGAAARAPGVTPDAAVRALEATNTLVRREGGWSAHNTDALAAERILREVLEGRTQPRCAVLGSGGAARGVVYAARQLGAEVTVFARNASTGTDLAAGLGARYGGGLDAVPSGFDVIANATPVGMAPEVERSPVAPEVFGPETCAYDLVYTPADTRFLRDARARGARARDGLAHFVAQAHAQLELWLGTERVAPLPPASLARFLSQP